MARTWKTQQRLIRTASKIRELREKGVTCFREEKSSKSNDIGYNRMKSKNWPLDLTKQRLLVTSVRNFQ